MEVSLLIHDAWRDNTSTNPRKWSDVCQQGSRCRHNAGSNDDIRRRE
jgi:hypothetical protein